MVVRRLGLGAARGHRGPALLERQRSRGRALHASRLARARSGRASREEIADARARAAEAHVSLADRRARRPRAGRGDRAAPAGPDVDDRDDDARAAAARGGVVSIVNVSVLLEADQHKHPHDAILLPNGDMVVATWAPGRISYWKKL